MTTVTSYTAARMQEIEDSAIVDGNIVGSNLILSRHDGATIDAGSVVGPTGPAGPAGSLFLGYAQTVVGQSGVTAVVDVVSCSVTVSVAAGRRLKITGQGSVHTTVANDSYIGRIKEGVNELGLWYSASLANVARRMHQAGFAIITPTAGSHTYKLTIERGIGTGSGTVFASASEPTFILVEDIGAI